jgi:hypothetical protein
MISNTISGANMNVEFPNMPPDEPSWSDQDITNYSASYPPFTVTIPNTSMRRGAMYLVQATGLTNGEYALSFTSPFLSQTLLSTGTVATSAVLAFQVFSIPETNDFARLRLTRATNGVANVVLTGPAGNYVLERSSDLTDWRDEQSVFVNNSRSNQVTTSVGPVGTAFFRARRE